MKSQKGITLISLSIYVIALLVILTVLATVSGMFFKSYQQTSKKVPTLTEYTKFTSFISEEVNREGVEILQCENDDENGISYVVFNNNVQYTYVQGNESIYRDKVKVCRNVEDCHFDFAEDNGKKQLTVSVKFTNETNPKIMTYTLRN